MGILSLNINVLQTQHLDAIRAMRPAATFILDPKSETSGAVKAAHPGTLLIGRPYVPDSELHNWYLSGDPAQAGNRAAAICLEHRQSNPAVDAWILLNEPPVGSIDQIARLALFDMAFARAMWSGGSRGCIGAFARGTPQIPSIDGGAALRAYMPALRVAEDIGALVAIHQYGFSPLLKEAEWNALRWQIHILPWLASQGLNRFEYVVTETGCDLGTGRMEDGQVADGWKHAFGDTQAGRESYAGQLYALMSEYAKDYRCKGAMIFCAGNQNRWGSFDVTGEMLDRLMTIQWPPVATAPAVPPVTPPKPVEPQPPTEVPMTDKLVSILQAKLGSRFKDVRGDMPKGAGFYAYADSRKMPDIALHYSASAAGPTTPLGIAKFHTSPAPAGRGWPGIGYHFVIDDGTCYYVGSVDTQRAHVEGRNDTALGVCWTGTYETTLPGADHAEIGRLLVAGLDEFYGHQKKLRGHNQILPGHTLCPGRIVELIPLLRAPVVIPPKPTPLKYDKVVWAIEQSARILQQEGFQREHDYLLQVILPPLVKLRDDQR